MAVAATRRSRKKHFLPNSLEYGLKQGSIKSIGAGLIICALLCWASLLSWSVNDPSLNHATNATTNNLLGKSGAIFADILFQIFGLAAIFIILPIAAAGFRLLLNKPVDKLRLRLLSWPVSSVLLATTVTLLPRTEGWKLPQSYGGIAGDTMAQIFMLDAMTQSSTLYVLTYFLMLMALSVIAFSFTLGLTHKDLAVLFHIEDKEQFKATLKAPFNRFSYWLRYRSARTVDKNYNQRQWWRNAEPLTTNNNDYAKSGPDIYPPHNPAAQPDGKQALFNGKLQQPLMRPHTPADFRNGERSQHQIPPQNMPPHQMPPMSARPLHQAPQNPEMGTMSAKGLRPVGAGKAPMLNANMGLDQHQFILPPVELLNMPAPQPASTLSHDELLEMATMLETVLLDFGIKGSILNVRPGPVVTLFEFEPARGIKTARIVGLADDIARSMSALSARIAVIPGRSALGIELPNASFETVYLRDLVEAPEFYHTDLPLPLILGKAIGGEPVVTDLSAMPHLLIAGTTGSGKSVGINTMLLSLLYRLTPDQCRMIMIDPKMLELSIYDGIPHLLTPVVTDPQKAVSALKWAVREMEDRYRQMSKLGVRNIQSFNDRVNEANENGEPLTRMVQTGFDQNTGRAIFEEEVLEFEPIPMIVVVIDEMADLMMVAGKEIEAAVQRLAQMARAAGIHVIMATQRPSVDVITGTIKANFPTRISFQVTSKIDSRTILGKEGAEQLLGRGDMLFMPGGSRMLRVHGAFVGDDEVEKVVEHLRSQGAPEYLDTITLDDDLIDDDQASATNDKSGDLFDEAVAIVIRDQKASISYLQRRLSIGYNRAATLIERMEEEGIVSEAGRNGKREILRDSY